MFERRSSAKLHPLIRKALWATGIVTVLACGGAGNTGTLSYEEFIYRSAGSGGRHFYQVNLPEVTQGARVPTNLAESVILGPVAGTSLDGWVVRFTFDEGYSLAKLDKVGDDWVFESIRPLPGLDPILSFSVSGRTFAFERSVNGMSKVFKMDQFDTAMTPVPAPSDMPQRDPVVEPTQQRIYWTTGTTLKCTTYYASGPTDPEDLGLTPVAGWSPAFDRDDQSLWFIGPDPANGNKTTLFHRRSSGSTPVVEVHPSARNLRVGEFSLVYSFSDDGYGGNTKLRMHPKAPAQVGNYMDIWTGPDYGFVGDFVKGLADPTVGL